MEWIRTASSKAIDSIKAEFQKVGYIDWRQGKTKYGISDIVYIYVTSPIQRIEFKTEVEKLDIPLEEATDNKESLAGDGKSDEKYVRLKFIEYIDDERLNLKNLKDNGFTASLQGPSKIKDEIVRNYINKIFNEHSAECDENDILLLKGENAALNGDGSLNEGSMLTIQVNRYERSSKARKICLDHYGYKCMVCGFDFEKVYGELGKGIIEVHHKKALSEIKEDYNVDPINDLIPLCSNCHTVIHSKNDNLSVEKLIQVIKIRE